jgi:hypothetical protein
MAQYYLNIFSDLLETDPSDPFLLPDPYDDNLDIKSNIETFYRLIRWSIRINDRIQGLVNAYYLGYLLEVRLSTPSKRRKYRKILSKHYLDACIRVYNLYKITGIQQIYRSKRTSFWMFRKINRPTYIQLLQDALTLL